MKLLHRIILGGGILLFAIAIVTLPNLRAIELTQICTNPSNTNCEITKPYDLITNNDNFRFLYNSDSILLSTNGAIETFINYGTIANDSGYPRSLYWDNDGYVRHIINYGTMDGIGGNRGGTSADIPMFVTNYGRMRGIDTGWGNADITIENYGIIDIVWHQGKSNHLGGGSNYNFILKNYAMIITQNADTFNHFDGNPTDGDNSHLVVNGGGIKFADSSAKIILNFDGDFSFGEAYLLDKLIIDNDSMGTNRLKVEFDRLVVTSDIYHLKQQGDSFIVYRNAEYSAVGSLYKANIRTMNNFMTMSNSMIYPRKYSKSQNLRKSSLRADSQNLRKSSLRMSEANVAIQDLNANETFAYQNESQNLQTHRIKRQNKRNYSRSRNPRNNNPVILSDSEESKKKQNRDSSHYRAQNDNKRFSQNLAQNPHDYYFILTSFVNHNLFFQSGRYNLSGFDYGFLTAFSARVAESNSLGAHFMMSYGSLGDSHDKNFHISNLNLNLGLNYKLDLIWDMYLKARGDFFYFLNQVKTLTMIEAIKPNNLGFGVSVSYGKDFDFKQGGILGIEGGIDYKALSASEITLNSMSETYQKSLYHLLYLDLGISYAKYFGNFGFNANLGIKGNITANKLAKSQIRLNVFNRSVDMILDNDKVLGYANVGLSYVLNNRNFDMEFSLAYYGNYGDRIISNGGGFEWRVGW